jgi:ATP synthase protein I
MVGWSVAIPTVLGIAIGVWLDANTDTGFSWTLTLLITGVIVGSMTAWYWIQKELKMIEQEREDLDHE